MIDGATAGMMTIGKYVILGCLRFIRPPGDKT
jgi:hypothetical protein